MVTWLVANWMWILLGYFILEKVVKLTPTPYDDITVDILITGIWKVMKFIANGILSKGKSAGLDDEEEKETEEK
jgi:hypothetical protein